MEILGLSGSTPKTEGRLKTLFWPTIANDFDADHLSSQGFTMCLVIAGITLGFGLITGRIFETSWDAVFFLLSGIGIRQRSCIAAVGALIVYVGNSVLLLAQSGSGAGVVRIIVMGLLLSNVRATFLAAKWRAAGMANAVHEVPPDLNPTFWDKFSTRMPRAVWPKARFVYYVMAALSCLGIVVLMFVGTVEP